MLVGECLFRFMDFFAIHEIYILWYLYIVELHFISKTNNNCLEFNNLCVCVCAHTCTCIEVVLMLIDEYNVSANAVFT